MVSGFFFINEAGFWGVGFFFSSRKCFCFYACSKTDLKRL